MPNEENSSAKWRQLALLAAAVWLAMSLWFSASSVRNSLVETWSLAKGQEAWLTIGVQIGFVIGTLASAILNLSDRVAVQRLFAISALLGAIFNAIFALVISDGAGKTWLGFTAAIGLRVLTGVTLAGVYPPGMKLMASWFKQSRGLAIGVLVGALTIGSGTPHLLKLLLSQEESSVGWPVWRTIMLTASSLAVVASAIGWFGLRTGPHVGKAATFQWSYFVRIWGDKAMRRANFGYLGHMFELYAMWTAVPILLSQTLSDASVKPAGQAMAAFGIFAAGCLGCVVAGLLADQLGRTRIAIASLVISGGCALFAGFLVETPALLVIVCLLWGFAVVADSAQFSAAVSELCDPRYVGTALTIQTCAGFLLTTATIYLVTAIQDSLGTGITFAILAAGPVFGIYHMARLRGMPEAAKMASGNR